VYFADDNVAGFLWLLLRLMLRLMLRLIMAPQTGLEPVTYGLTVRRSTN
jgi:hypothetical protein